MKKLIALIIALVSVCVLVGCSFVAVEGGVLLKDGHVTTISITSLPEGYEYTFKGEDAKSIIDYLQNLNLTPYSKSNDYNGMAWIISIEYETGEIVRVCHSCNKLISADDGPWYEMTYEEANRIYTLLDGLSIS